MSRYFKEEDAKRVSAVVGPEYKGTDEIAKEASVGAFVAYQILARMLYRGEVQRLSNGRGSRPVKWRIALSPSRVDDMIAPDAGVK